MLEIGSLFVVKGHIYKEYSTINLHLLCNV